MSEKEDVQLDAMKPKTGEEKPGGGETLVNFSSFKKKKRNKNKRKREMDSIDEDGTTTTNTTTSTNLHVAKKTTSKMNSFSTGGTKLTNTDLSIGMKSTRESASHVYAGGATEHLRIETEFDRDAQSIREKNLQYNETGEVADADGKYRGKAGYLNHLKKTKDQLSANKFTGTQGPIRAQLFARSSVRWDYQPDVCKDYKQTGFCGYGDSCKFMHDRGDYKQGWQLEKEWAEKEKKREARVAAGLHPDDPEEEEENYVIDSDDEEDVPFACLMCKESFDKPVVTKCGHYFCESCAIKRYKKNSKCAVCGAQTNGVFNVAKNIISKMEKMK